MSKKDNVTENIRVYMNSLSKREKFSYIDVSFITSSINIERMDRLSRKLPINPKTKLGRNEINKRTADLVNQRLSYSDNRITAEDIKLYKNCKSEEYQVRKQRCHYGFRHMRERMGYDPLTGMELYEI